MRFKLEIECDNDAFATFVECETARLLESASRKLRDGHTDGTLVDHNGNTVGSFGFEED